MVILKTLLSIFLAVVITVFLNKYDTEVNVKSFIYLSFAFYAMLTGIPTDAIIRLISNFKQRVAFKWTN